MRHEPINRFRIALISIIAAALGVLGGFFYKSWLAGVIITISAVILLNVYFAIASRLNKYKNIKKMEDAFPDFIQLMSSNLRAGITIDKALLLSARKEFNPLDKEIYQLGKDLVTGKEIDRAMIAMAQRIGSDKISKTVSLIISGIRSGGDLAVLLEETAVNMRQRDFVEKRAASNVLMYTIFIFFAVAVGSPVLFSLSSVLVQILTKLFSNLPQIDSNISLPFTLTKISVSVNFVTYFSLVFMVTTDILASLVLGLVGKGEEKEGMKYILPLVGISLTLFFVSRLFLLNYFSGFFG